MAQETYNYGVALDRTSGKPVIFVKKKGLPPGTLKHAKHQGAPSMATRLAKEMLASSDRWYDMEPLTPVAPPSTRTYVYGLQPTETKGFRPFVILAGKEVPKGSICVLEHEGTGVEARELAKALRPSYEDVHGPPPEPSEPAKVEPGVVVCHVDEGGQHMGVVLREMKYGEWLLLFFTSNRRWSRRSRSATNDELALAGLKTTKKTYLGSAVRSGEELIPTRRSFPEHRVEALLEEFDLTRKRRGA